MAVIEVVFEDLVTILAIELGLVQNLKDRAGRITKFDSLAIRVRARYLGFLTFFYATFAEEKSTELAHGGVEDHIFADCANESRIERLCAVSRL